MQEHFLFHYSALFSGQSKLRAANSRVQEEGLQWIGRTLVYSFHPLGSGVIGLRDLALEYESLNTCDWVAGGRALVLMPNRVRKCMR